MRAASVALVDALATRANDRTSSQVLTPDVSLGGWTVNLRRVCFDTAARYATTFAGGDVRFARLPDGGRRSSARAAGQPR